MQKSGIALLLVISPFFLFGQDDHIFALQNKDHGFRIEVDTLVTDNAEIRPFDSNNPISGLVFSGDIALHSDTSLVRIILTDSHYNEYLIYEAYPILSGSGRFSVHEAAEEASLLNNITPDRVMLELVDASVHLKEIIVSEGGVFHAQTKRSRMYEQSLNKIDRINQNIQKTGQKWVAGETSISGLSYQEKKSMFGGRVPNFQGFEYYIGGVFVLPGVDRKDPGTKGTASAFLSQQESPYPFEFSWRNRHGINWVSPVKHQGGSCGSCTAFGTAAAAELLVNLYFNRVLEYDLSEQQILSCNGSCEHGVFTNIALNYMTNTGIVLEDCFPYTASDADCSEICSDPSERIKIGNWNTVYFNEEDKKRGIIQGATVGKLTSWVHVVQVVGYKTIEAGDILYMKDDSILGISVEEDNPLTGKTAWQIKNSWGTNWGTDGFGYVVENGGYLELYTIHGPVSSLVLNEEDISCTDNDGDGFYFWGTGPKPSHCPECPDQADGDDSNRCIGPMDEHGNLFYFTPSPETKDTIILYGNSPDLYVEGSNIRWYTDRKLQDLAHTGNLFHTGQTEPGKYTYYVTQTLSGCESNPGAITLSLVTGIPPPIGHDTTIDVGESAVIAVEGEQGAVFKWYKDPSLTNLLATGDNYLTGKTEKGAYTHYVTQTLCLIESPPDTVLLKIKDLVNIPDDRFREALIMEGVDQDGDKVISLAEAEAVDSLSISFHDITNMSGIEAFVNLRYLACSHNLLTSLDVTANPALAFLDCGRNQLTNLDISGKNSLCYLNCSNNQLTSLNVTRCTSLYSLDCSSNQLSNLDISNNTVLGILNVYNMQNLHEVCVWDRFDKDKLDIDTWNSPNVCFQTDCNGDCRIVERDDSHESGIFMYPNPAHSYLTIKTDTSDRYLMEITSLNGQLILCLEMEGFIQQVNLSSLRKGVYFITIRSKDFVTTRKIIKL